MTRTLKLTLLLALALCVAGAAVAQTSSSTVVHRTGTVLAKYDGKVVVQMDDGTVKEFTPKPGKTIMVDGKETGYDDLKVGTVLGADFVKTTSTVPVQTTTIKNADVIKIVANTLVVRNEAGDYKSHTIPSGFKFLVDGKQVSLTDIKPGMKLTATIVSTATKTVTESEVKGVGGTGPAPAAAPAAAPAPPPPAPAAAPAPAPEPAPEPAKLPKTGSPLPLAALGGALSLLAGLGLRFRRTR